MSALAEPPGSKPLWQRTPLLRAAPAIAEELYDIFGKKGVSASAGLCSDVLSLL